MIEESPIQEQEQEQEQERGAGLRLFAFLIVAIGGNLRGRNGGKV